MYRRGAKIISLALLLALVFSLAPISASADVLGLQPPVALAEETQGQVQTRTASLQERLVAIEGVTSVTPIEQTPLEDGTLPFKEKYLVTITQPISWDDPSLGTFEQRVEVGYQGDTNVTEYETGGYMLYDVLYPDYLKGDDRDELCRAYNANYVSFEYRFFGESTPAGLSSGSTDL